MTIYQIQQRVKVGERRAEWQYWYRSKNFRDIKKFLSEVKNLYPGTKFRLVKLVINTYVLKA